jgi:hypothetical protein
MAPGLSRQEALTRPGSVISTPAEEKSVQDRVAIGAHVVYETIRREGEDELKRSNSWRQVSPWGSPSWLRRF